MTDRLVWQFVDRDSPDLIIVFHSKHQAGWTSFFGERQIKFDFFKIVGSFRRSSLFFMDSRQGWYQDTFEDIFATSNEILARHGFARCYTMGASYGGYAAIVVGSLIQQAAVKCLAFSPQTDLRERTTRSLQQKLGKPAGFTPFLDHRAVRDHRYLDCKPYVARAGRTTFHIVYSAGSLWDKYYAEYLGELGNVVREPHSCSDHNIGAHLLRDGRLVPTIRRVLDIGGDDSSEAAVPTDPDRDESAARTPRAPRGVPARTE